MFVKHWPVIAFRSGGGLDFHMGTNPLGLSKGYWGVNYEDNDDILHFMSRIKLTNDVVWTTML